VVGVKTMMDEVFDNILKQLKTASSNNERYEILKNNGLWNGKETEICERCKSAHKFGDLNMCVVVEWCKWDLSYKWFRKERQSQNSRDCKNFLDDECIKHSDSCSKDNHEKCMTCKHFEKKE
jgi:hypothetical protein